QAMQETLNQYASELEAARREVADLETKRQGEHEVSKLTALAKKLALARGQCEEFERWHDELQEQVQAESRRLKALVKDRIKEKVQALRDQWISEFFEAEGNAISALLAQLPAVRAKLGGLNELGSAL